MKTVSMHSPLKSCPSLTHPTSFPSKPTKILTSDTFLLFKCHEGDQALSPCNVKSSLQNWSGKSLSGL